MALFILFISFFSALYGAWVFFTGYFGAENATQQLTAAMAGIGFALIPYIVGRSLSEMVAIRQRHLMLEQTTLQQRMMLEAMDEAAREAEATEQQSAPPESAPPAPPQG
ncbi:MAG: hypothetical protein P8P30_01800 [Rickettsiales bacterium]|nr:hypothetical protein [Rickettsiales bacterium]